MHFSKSGDLSPEDARLVPSIAEITKIKAFLRIEMIQNGELWANLDGESERATRSMVGKR